MLNNSQTPPLIYLDNFVWSKLVKSSAGLMAGEEAEIYRAALPTLQDMVTRGIIVCPVSFTHLAELSTFKTQKIRAQAIALMGTLSQGVCLPWAVVGQAPKRSLTDVFGLFPSGQNLLYMREFLDGLPPVLALCEVLDNGTILAEMVEATIQALNEVLRTRQVPVAEIKREVVAPEMANANVDESWYNEVFRLRLADPNRKVEPGDTMDLLNLLYASMTDAAVLDKATSAMVKSSKLKKFWVGHRIEDLLEHLRGHQPKR